MKFLNNSKSENMTALTKKLTDFSMFLAAVSCDLVFKLYKFVLVSLSWSRNGP
jgi:hypothetical protein